MTILTILLAICMTSICSGQPGIEVLNYYHVTQGGIEFVNDIFHRSDGGYYACGFSNGQNWILSLDENSEIIWNRALGEGSLNSVIETDEGDMLTGGKVGGFGARKVSSDGEIIWENTYNSGLCQAVIELKNGSYALAGRGNEAPYIVITNTDGNAIWERRLADYRMDTSYLMALRETEDGIVAAGYYSPGDRNGARGILCKFDFEGEIEWLRIFESERGDWVYSMTSRQGGGFALVSMRPGPGRQDWFSEAAFSLILTDAEGNLQSQLYYPAGRFINEFPASISRMSDGGFVMSGETSITHDDAWGRYPVILRVDAQGNLIWRERLEEVVREQPQGGGIQRSLRSVITQAGERIVAVGTTYHEDGGGNRDGFLVRLFPDQAGPFIFYKSPEDSLLSAIQGDSLQFVVRAVSREGREMDYHWFINDNELGNDTTVTISFDDLGVALVTCQVSEADATVEVGWSVTVTDLYIAAHTPDTLDLTLRRGSTVHFEIDSVAAIQAEDTIQYHWTLNDLDRQEEVSGGDAQATAFDFTRSGHYTVEGMAYRGESHDEVVWDVEVKGAIWSFLPDELNVERLEGDNVEFQIIPTISDSLNWYTWLYDGGMIREGRDSVFVMNLFELGEHTIIGILADSVESDTVEWVVNVLSDFVGQGGQDARPTEFGIASVSPNPFNAMLTIRFSTGSQAAPTRLAVYDLSGREVARLFDSHTRPPSHSHTLTWNASSVPAGVYIVRLQQGEQVSTKKVVLLR